MDVGVLAAGPCYSRAFASVIERRKRRGDFRRRRCRHEARWMAFPSHLYRLRLPCDSRFIGATRSRRVVGEILKVTCFSVLRLAREDFMRRFGLES